MDMPERINVYLTRIDRDIIISNEDKLIEKVSDWRKEKLSRLKNPSVRAESLAAGLLLRYAVDRELGKEFGEYDIEAGPQGKPHFKGAEGMEFNISHSGDFVAAVISRHPVGIDIEVKSDTKFRVTKRMFSESEQKRVFESADPDREFRAVWTEKEAYLKCTGEGISVALKSFYKDMETSEIMREAEGEYRGTGCYITTLKPEGEDYCLSVCSKDIKFTLDIINVNEL
jgi:4'-phosphopantetheinyl transferase